MDGRSSSPCLDINISKRTSPFFFSINKILFGLAICYYDKLRCDGALTDWLRARVAFCNFFASLQFCSTLELSAATINAIISNLLSLFWIVIPCTSSPLKVSERIFAFFFTSRKHWKCCCRCFNHAFCRSLARSFAHFPRQMQHRRCDWW